LANGRLKDKYLANPNISPVQTESPGYYTSKLVDTLDPFYPRFWEDRLMAGDAFLKSTKKALGIFPCDMSDWCGIGIPESWSNRIIEMARRYPQHRFYLLTKQPQNLIKWSPFPDNCQVGVTVCNDKMLDVAVDKLEDIQAQTKFISFEPLLHRLTLSLDYALYYSGISWLIIGAQTKPYKPPEISWVQEIVRAADKAGIPVFLKDNLKPLLENEPLNTLYWANVSNDERGHERVDDELRQEIPEC